MLFIGLFANSFVVGYAETPLQQDGATMVSAQFITLGTEGIKLSDLTPVGTNIPTEGDLILQTLTSDGRVKDKYLWLDYSAEAETPEEAEELRGWFYNGGAKVDVTFEPGQGLWITLNSKDASVSIQCSGKVNLELVQIKLCDGSVAIGNPFPAKLALQNIALSKVSESSVIDNEGGIMIQTLTSDGRVNQKYLWLDYSAEAETEDEKLALVGWFLNGGAKVDVDFDPGQGFWVTGTNDQVWFNMPTPL